jgi:hypothetical protein
MNELNRTVPTTLPDFLTERNEFCVCRVIEDCALIKIESLAKLPAAKQYMRRVASRVPGSYLVFSYKTRRVLGKVVNRAMA